MLSHTTRRIRLTYTQVYSGIALVFLMTTATSLGPYSTRAGPYWLIGLLLLLFLIAFLQLREMLQLLLRPGCLFGATFFLALWLFALFSDTGVHLGLGMPMFTGLVCYLLAMWVAFRLTSKPKLAWLLLLALSFAICMNLYEFLIAPNTWSTALGRAAGFFENPNSSGTLIAGLFALWLATRYGVMNLFTTVVMCLTFIAVLITFSRSAIFTFIILSGLVIFLNVWRHRRFRMSTFLVLCAVVATVWFSIAWIGGDSLSKDASMRISSIQQGNFADASSEGRRDALEVYIQLFLENPLSGAGVFHSLSDSNGQGPHNAFAAAAADFGVLGLFSYLAIMLIGLLGARRLGWRNERAVVPLVISIWLLFSSMFSHNIFYSSGGAMMIGFLMGALASSIYPQITSSRPRYSG